MVDKREACCEGGSNSHRVRAHAWMGSLRQNSAMASGIIHCGNPQYKVLYQISSDLVSPPPCSEVNKPNMQRES